jgi:hypothetical protein
MQTQTYSISKIVQIPSGQSIKFVGVTNGAVTRFNPLAASSSVPPPPPPPPSSLNSMRILILLHWGLL